MKNAIIFLLTILVASHSYGQGINLSLGKIMSNEEYQELFQGLASRSRLQPGSGRIKQAYFDPKTQKAYVGFRFGSRKGYQIGTLDGYTNLNETNSLQANFGVGEKQKVYILGFLNLKKRPHIIIAISDKEAKEEYVIASAIDEKAQMVGEPFLLERFEGKLNFFSPVFLSVSPDQQGFVVGKEQVEGIASVGSLSFTVFNNQLEVKAKETIEVAKVIENFVLENISLDNNHNVFVQGYTHKSAAKNIGRLNKEIAKPVVALYNAASKSFTNLPLDNSSTKDFVGSSVFLDNKGYAFAIELYGEKEVEYVISSINPRKGNLNWTTVNTLNKEQTKSIKAPKASVQFFHPSTLSSFNNQLYVTFESTVYMSGQGIEASSGSILVCQLNKQSGQLTWQKIVTRKTSIGGYFAFTGHQAYANQNGLTLLYNDDVTNLNLPAESEKVKFFKKQNQGMLVATNFSSEGKIIKKALFTTEEEKGLLLEVHHMIEINDKLYQIKVSDPGMFGSFSTAYGTVKI